MRIFVLPLWALLCVVPTLFAQVQRVPARQYSPDLYIPTVLQKTVKVEKIHPGDEIRFGSVEAVLLRDGIVIPAGAHLYGHVMASELLEVSSESRLSIEVDRAEWGHSKVTLHAFISGIGLRRQVVSEQPNSRCGGYDPDAQGQSFGPAFLEHPDCSMGWRQNETVARDVGFKLDELKLLRNLRNGSTMLVSRKKNIHLPGGLLIMLHNVSANDSELLVQAASKSP
jgi:hypothetical protein